MNNDYVIVAQATPPGVAGVSIVRLSGPDSKIKKMIPLLSNLSVSAVKPRMASFAYFYDQLKNKIDEGLLLYFEGPNSYTGESVLELQSHGGVMVPRLIIEACMYHGCRQAAPGEFSLRAVLNDKMTTLKAEAICGLIHADNEAQARAALRSMRGDFSEKIANIERRIKHFRVMLESAIDFDGEDINPNTSLSELVVICEEIEKLYHQTQEAVSVNHDQHVCLLGPPNAGKSSWLNRLMKDDVAIVNAEAGTTRDLIEKRLLIRNRWVQITDTAGIRETKNTIELEGVKRAKAKVDSVDLVVWVVDLSDLSDLDTLSKDLPTNLISDLKRMLILWNKKDQHQVIHKDLIWRSHPVHCVSSFDEHDVRFVLDLISKKIIQPTSDAFYARQRHLDVLANINRLSCEVLSQAQETYDVVWVAEVMRETQLELDKLVGLFSTDDLLGEIFGSFCIGK
ncbi:MAG: tRNA uridine-5-carboxymethylaminomethyl(34) synthesis GTPase MnmE [Gammaproteobacteria bacterium]|nr:tRNA uridine-5-carboxymethylaminomethyl(34) synthesis GTPase MnmE [Gammaproteobacteria bacterium]